MARRAPPARRRSPARGRGLPRSPSVRGWAARPPVAAPQAPPAASAEAPPPPAAGRARTPLTGFAVVAERNLFSPTRTETAPEPPRPSDRSRRAGPARAEAAALRSRDPRRGPRPRLPGGHAAAAGLRVLGGGPGGGRPPRADQAGSGRAAPGGRDLRGAALRPLETSPVCRPRRAYNRQRLEERAGRRRRGLRCRRRRRPRASGPPGAAAASQCRFPRRRRARRRRNSRPRRNDREDAGAPLDRGPRALPSSAGAPAPEPAGPSPRPPPRRP